MKSESDASLTGLKWKAEGQHGAAGGNQLKWLLKTLIIIEMNQMANWVQILCQESSPATRTC